MLPSVLEDEAPLKSGKNITIRVKDTSDHEVDFHVWKVSRLGKVRKACAIKFSKDMNKVRLWYNGCRIKDDDTAARVSLKVCLRVWAGRAWWRGEVRIAGCAETRPELRCDKVWRFCRQDCVLHLLLKVGDHVSTAPGVSVGGGGVVSLGWRASNL